MFRLKIERLLNDFHIKQKALIDLIDSDRVAFPKKLKDNSFTDEEKKKILDKYGALL